MQRTVVIVGGGPAGSSLGIRLAHKGFRVTLVEREKFPREKLCGEFISPECFSHFSDLGVSEEMCAAGGQPISETVFYAPNGKGAHIPSDWFGYSATAFGLSRAEMDNRLLKHAERAGVDVRTGTTVSAIQFENGRAAGIRCKTQARELMRISSDLLIDASGRSAILSKLAARTNGSIQGKTKKSKPDLVAFKAHMRGADVNHDRCEIYAFPGGYGGLNFIENGLANFCFLIRSDLVKELRRDPQAIIKTLVFQNTRAAETLRRARPAHAWLAVTVDRFGLKTLNPYPGILCVGDAAAFIDPFTGSGMLMALESSELLAESVDRHYPNIRELSAQYERSFCERFSGRLRVCNILRLAAYRPALAHLLIRALSANKQARRLLMRRTR